jgi:hypothetical protein
LRVGDVVDFWRVEAVEPPRLLRLRAEMRLPGDAWLEWSIEPEPGANGTVLVQRALFRPRGLSGRAYWYAISPMHRFIFGPLAGRIIERAARADLQGRPAARVHDARVPVDSGALPLLGLTPSTCDQHPRGLIPGFGA